MRRIDAAFEHLEIISLLVKQSINSVLVRYAEKLKIRQLWQILRKTHVSPNDAAALDARVARVLNILLELLIHGNIGHVDAFTARRVFPSMISAAQAVLLDATEIQGSKPMGTKGADQPDLAGHLAKEHQIFAEKSNAQRFAARFFEVCRRY